MPSDKSWIEQSEPGGEVFTDSYLHNECSYIRHWDSRDEWLKQLKELDKTVTNIRIHVGKVTAH